MKKNIKKIIIGMTLITSLCVMGITRNAQAVLVTTFLPGASVSNTTYESTKVSGKVSVPDNTSIILQIRYATSTTDLESDSKRKQKDIFQQFYATAKEDSFSTILDGLKPDTTYYFKFYDAKNSAISAAYSFKTTSLPTVTFKKPYAILGATEDKQTFSTDISFSENAPKTTAFVRYGKESETGVLSKSVTLWINEDKQKGTIYPVHKVISGLEPETKYKFKFYISFSNVVTSNASSSEEKFTTPKAAVTTNPTSKPTPTNPTQALEFESPTGFVCFEKDEFCSGNTSARGKISGVIDTIVTMYPQSEVLKNPSNPSLWQKGVSFPPKYPLAANNITITPGVLLSLSSGMSYADLKTLPTKSGTTDTIFIPLVSYKLKSGGSTGMPTTGTAAAGSYGFDITKIAAGSSPVTTVSTTTNTTSSGTYQVTCGGANGGTFSTAPDNALCVSPAAASAVTPAAPSGWTWSCAQIPYASANCRAGQSATAPKGSDLITTQQGTGTGEVNLGGGGPGATTDTTTKTDVTTGDGSSADLPKKYLQNPFKNLDTFPKIIKAVMNNIVLPIAVPFIAIMIIYSGFLFVIAKKESNTYNIERAKTTLKNTLIGAALILGAFVIANALQATLNTLLK